MVYTLLLLATSKALLIYTYTSQPLPRPPLRLQKRAMPELHICRATGGGHTLSILGMGSTSTI